jgi:ribose/xylose/arabinose/galactoside ABC-type transport system permease subunit
LNGILVARFKIQPIIVTLVVMIAGRGLAQIILGELFTSLLFTPFGDFGRLRLSGVPVQIVIMSIVVAAMLFIAGKTSFAKRVEAIGDNSRAARLVGINTVAVTVSVYVLCGLLCAIAGNMEAARINGVNVGSLGVLIELDAIAAVAIGGTPFSGGKARIMGTVFGAIVVQLVTIIVNMNDIAFHYSLIFKALIVIIALWTQRKK